MSIQVKICGLTGREAAEAAITAGAAFGGLVFHRQSPRHLTIERAEAVADVLRGRIAVVALFVDPPDSDIAEVVGAVSPDLIQLHGNESPARAAAIGAAFGRPVIKAFHIAEAADLARVSAYDGAADYFLFDAKVASAARPGGTGTAFDWALLSGRTFSRPWFLAGGLNETNVTRAVAVSGARMVDVSTGVEASPGRKDPGKIAAFVRAVRDVPYTESS